MQASNDPYQLYDPDFWRAVRKSSGDSARAGVPILLADPTIRNAASDGVIDVGCGTGDWLHQFAAQGYRPVLGIDGEWAPKLYLEPRCTINLDEELAIPPGCFYKRGSFGNYGLALCLETAEHLKPETGPQLVSFLCNTAPVVIFSAATPGQGGTGHFNERPHEYWHNLFGQNSFSWDDRFQAKFRENPMIASWYADNIFVYRSMRPSPPWKLWEFRLPEIGIPLVDHSVRQYV